MSREFLIYCDESDDRGSHYSNFYGGLLVRSKDFESAKEHLNSIKAEIGIDRELKWQRVTAHYLDAYKRFADGIFDLVEKDIIKIRIMFTDNRTVLPRFDGYQRDNKYFLLYYQFLKHAFGLQYADKLQPKIGIRIFLDQLPDTKEKSQQFKEYLSALSKFPQFKNAGVLIHSDGIAEVDSSQHVLSQAVDIVLGAMQFRLNDKHLAKPKGATKRGKRTIAKEKLYKHINSRIREIYPGFNIGISTGLRGDHANRWHDHYRHWLFVPRGATVDRTRSKNKK